MKDDTAGEFVAVILVIAILAVMFFAGRMTTTEPADQLRADAIKAGVAEYYIDANNERAFRWKGAK